MLPNDISPGKSASAAHLRTVALCLGLVAGMGGLAYASAPLYRLFCEVTGYLGTTQRAGEAPDRTAEREVTVRLDANVAPGLSWRFEPVEREIKVRLGEVATVRYFAENRSDRATIGTATFNVTPESTGLYFNKLECFCFTETKLAPGERLEMPVVFFVDAEMADSEETGSVRTITLSYTFYAVSEETPLAAAPRQASGG